VGAGGAIAGDGGSVETLSSLGAVENLPAGDFSSPGVEKLPVLGAVPKKRITA